MKVTKILFPILFIGILSLLVASEAELSKIEPAKAEAVEDWWLPPYLRVELTVNISTSSLPMSITNHLTPTSLQNNFQALYLILSAYEQQAEIFPLEIVSITPGEVFGIPVSYYEYGRMGYSFIVPVSYYNSTEDGTMSWEDHEAYTRTETEVLQEEGFIDTGESLTTRLEKSDDSTILDEPKLEYEGGVTPTEELDWNYFTATTDLNQTVWDWTLDALSITNETALQWLAANTTEIEQIIPWESEDGFGQDTLGIWGLPSIPNPLKEVKKIKVNNVISGITKIGGTIAGTYQNRYPLSPKNIYKTASSSIKTALNVADKTKKIITSVPGAVGATVGKVGAAAGKLVETGTGITGLLSNLVKNPLSLLSGFKLPGLLGSLGKFKKYIIIGAVGLLLILGLVFLGPPIMGMLGARKTQKTVMQQMPYGGRRYSKKGRKQ